MSKPNFIDVKNMTNVGRWWARWKMLGGSFFGVPPALQDLRNDEQLRSYRDIEIKRRHSPYGDAHAQVVNLAAWRLRRARRRAAG